MNPRHARFAGALTPYAAAFAALCIPLAAWPAGVNPRPLLRHPGALQRSTQRAARTTPGIPRHTPRPGVPPVQLDPAATRPGNTPARADLDAAPSSTAPAQTAPRTMRRGNTPAHGVSGTGGKHNSSRLRPLCTAERVRLQTIRSEIEQRDLSRVPFSSPAPWSADRYLGIPRAALKCLAGTLHLSLLARTAPAAGQRAQVPVPPSSSEPATSWTRGITICMPGLKSSGSRSGLYCRSSHSGTSS